MQFIRPLLPVLILGLLTNCQSNAPTEVSFQASDGAIVYGQYYPTHDPSEHQIIIMFHQGRSNGRGEYEYIAKQLLARGFNVLAIDQRSGGDLYGSENRTVIARGGESVANYDDVYPDIKGALSWVQNQEFFGQPYLWGSSYSGALAIRLAAEHPDEIAKLILFSPPPDFVMGASSVSHYIEKVSVPVFALRPLSEMENFGSASQLERFKQLGVRTYISDPGAHASSMLVEERAGGDVTATWDEVWDFLTDQVEH